MTSEQLVSSSVRKILEGCGLTDTLATETLCVQAIRAPNQAFLLPSHTLSKYLRTLKGKAVSDKGKQSIEEGFMKLVTKVSI